MLEQLGLGHFVRNAQRLDEGVAVLKVSVAESLEAAALVVAAVTGQTDGLDLEEVNDLVLVLVMLN